MVQGVFQCQRCGGWDVRASKTLIYGYECNRCGCRWSHLEEERRQRERIRFGDLMERPPTFLPLRVEASGDGAENG